MDTRTEENRKKRQAICQRLKELRPKAEIIVDKYNEAVLVYSASVVRGKVVINKTKRDIYIISCPEKLARLCLTKEEAQQAIEKYLEQAKDKALLIAKRIDALEKELDFNTSYVMEGDTHGIYNDYSSICFGMGGFSFEYELEDLYDQI